MDGTAARRKTLLQMKALLEKGPLNWTEPEVPTDRRVHLDHRRRPCLIRHSSNSELRRERIERDGSVQSAIEKAKTFTGLFQRIKTQVDLIGTELRRLRRNRFPLLWRRPTQQH
jgi:hypothetical protein